MGVALDHRLIGPGRFREAVVAVDEQEVGAGYEGGGGAAHGFHRGPEDVHRVDLFRRAHPHPDGQRPSANGLEHRLALRGLQLLAVVDARNHHALRQDHGPGYHRSGQAPPARLVEAGDVVVTSIPEVFF